MRWQCVLEGRLVSHRDRRRWRPRLWVLSLLLVLLLLLLMLWLLPVVVLVLVQLWMTRKVDGLSVATLAPICCLLLFGKEGEKKKVV